MLGPNAANATRRVIDNAGSVAGCTVIAGTPNIVQFNSAVGGNTCGANSSQLVAQLSSFVQLNLTMDISSNSVTISIKGPADKWFAIGFGASEMKGTYSIAVDGRGNVTEHKLGDHELGSVLEPSVALVSAEVVGGLRTVVLSRNFQGKTADYFTFSAGESTIPVIDAVGSGAELGYHQQKTSSSAMLLPTSGDGACICAENPAAFGQAKGSLMYNPVSSDPGERGAATSIRFNNMCAPAPRGDLLWQRNPTCDVRCFISHLCSHPASPLFVPRTRLIL